ncbi:hypothetical protein VTN96DRAFT_4471 [Rasamsonia emersonii]
MPTEIHNVHVHWIKNEFSNMLKSQFLTFPEWKFLDFNVGTRFTGFSGIYTGSSKEPDLFIRLNTYPLPTVVVESGWSESWPHLQSDKNLWFSGGPAVTYVILLQWSKGANNRVKGVVEVYHRNAVGAEILLHHEDISPIPALAAQLIIPITLGEIFGAGIFQGRNQNAVHQMSLANLRPLARERLLAMGLTPA